MAMKTSGIDIAGAGPAGLTAAITLAHAGMSVVVREAQAEVCYRFQRGLQGLENWRTEQDALAVPKNLGIDTDFKVQPCCMGTVFDAWDQAYGVHSEAPLFYMVERGPGVGSLDHALLQLAVGLGVEVRYNSRLRQMHGPAIFATGPKSADAVAVGNHFDTPMSDGFCVICDDKLAPQGYAYLLVMGGRGTVKSCMFRKTAQTAVYVQRTVAAFERLAWLQMADPKPHGGVGNFSVPRSALSGVHAVAGEQAGFQDTRWGFGMRFTIDSGVLAARSLIEGSDYDALWQQDMGAMMRASVVNRAACGLLGNRGYRWALRHQESRPDARAPLQRHNRPSAPRRLFLPLARWRFRSLRQDASCLQPDCSCVWCRHGAGHQIELRHSCDRSDEN